MSIEKKQLWRLLNHFIGISLGYNIDVSQLARSLIGKAASRNREYAIFGWNDNQIVDTGQVNFMSH